MRVMVIVKASKNSEAGAMPEERLLREMGQFNEELVKAGVMQAGEGLRPSSAGKRVRFVNGERKVVDGPFQNTRELELRPIFETEDFAAQDPTGEVRAQEKRLREQVASKG
jgi:hypothetical protein